MKFGRVSSLLLASALALSCCGPQASAFSRQPDGWAAPQITNLEQAGLLDHVSTDSKAPDAAITRGEFCQILVDLVRLEGTEDRLNQVSPKSADYFADLAGTVTAANPGGRYGMYYAAAYGLSEGVLSDGERLADCAGLLTREQAAKMMCSLTDALERYAGVAPGTEGTAKTFTDRGAISSWAAEHVTRASALGIMQGDNAGRFNPQGTLTWQEACVMIERSYQAAEGSGSRQEGQTTVPGTTAGSFGPVADGVSVLDTRTEVAPYEYSYGSPQLLQNGGVVYIGENGDTVQVESYDASGASAGLRSIPVELEWCFDFYESDSAYYLAFGQFNEEEDDSREVYRIVRYDKNWNRLGSASVTGGESFTTKPYFATTHTDMAEENGTLVLYTARQRYRTSDGARHQSNIEIRIRTSDMKVLSVSGETPANHVSHSFAQYVTFDGGQPVYVDHGDAYPRSFALQIEVGPEGCLYQDFLRFSGEKGDNVTNAIPGGFGISNDCYLFAGASSPQRGNDSLTYANAFLSVMSKSGFPREEAELTWLTDYPAGGNTYVSGVWMTQVNNNTFVVMWQVTQNGGDGGFYYTVFDGRGNQVGQTVRKEGFRVPRNEPVVSGSTLRWVVPELSGKRGAAGQVREYELTVNANAAAREVTYTLELNPSSLSMGLGERKTLTAAAVGSDGSRQTVTAELTSSAPGVVSVERDGSLLSRSAGTATVTASAFWNGQTLTAACTVTAVQGQVQLVIQPQEVVMHVGEKYKVNVSFVGVPGSNTPTVRYRWNQVNGNPISVSAGGEITAYREGTYTVTASFTWEKQSCSTQFTVTVLP